MNECNSHENCQTKSIEDASNVSHAYHEIEEMQLLSSQDPKFSLPSHPITASDHLILPELNPPREEARISGNTSPDTVPQSTTGNQNRIRRDYEGEFNQNSLQYLLQNLDNLREILQAVIMNTELARSINIDLQSRNRYNLGIAQTLNNTQLSILNSQNQIYDQLRDIRRIIDEIPESDQQSSLLDFLNNQRNAARNNINQNQNPLSLIGRILTNIFGSQMKKSFNGILLVFFLCSILTIMVSCSSFPSFYKDSSTYFVDWLVAHNQSKSLLLALTSFYTIVILKLNQVLYEKFASDPYEQPNFFKDLYRAFAQYSPLYDLAFCIVMNLDIFENKLEFFFMLCLLIWYLILSKTVWLFHQKFNKALIMLNPSQPSELDFIKKIKYIMAAYILLNLQMSYGILWMGWYVSNDMFFVLLGMAVFTTIEPLKGFISACISIQSYSIISNNNSKQLSDPKFKSELFLDALYQIVFLGIICLLSCAYSKYLVGFLVLYGLSCYNALQKLGAHYRKYTEWTLLQKRLDEIFPIVEQEARDDHICSICHDSLLIGRKLPCGHIFHLKCFVYWLENKKNCPNCRADIISLNDIQNNTQQENRLMTLFRGWLIRAQEFILTRLN